MRSVLITGNNLGLNLEWVRQYAEEGLRVYATCRYPAQACGLQELAARYPGLSVHRMDLTREDEINAVAAELLEDPPDLLISNAGLYLEKYMQPALPQLEYEDWDYTFCMNTLRPVRLAGAFCGHLAHGRNPLLAVVCTHRACIEDISWQCAEYHRSTKAVLVAAMQVIRSELKARRIGLLLHPGRVLARVGGRVAPGEAAENVAGMRALIRRFTAADSGKFLRYDGVELHW